MSELFDQVIVAQGKSTQLLNRALAVQVQAAADQKDPKLTRILAENESLKSQIISNVSYLNPGNSNAMPLGFDVLTLKLETGWVVGVVNVTTRQLLYVIRSPKEEYCTEHINASLHILHQHCAEQLAADMLKLGQL
ncbi:hypothetical protein BLS_005119 [Venturia inaequalis]|uniref:Uncharacterized protein n=1 Tax=Venturia inaequalis TaxID=5025 RepID=A0A8H3VP02_VENIN|nr:hypothetical protein BLS_005119 [Venturia inaequalis]KAE9979124.1 hypothetical protein EG328_001065 [Venturia inaequalis]KAE9990274.1 hypothetical protein EG327_001606 [Venturia inaequalis]